MPLEEFSFLLNMYEASKLDYPEMRLFAWQSILLFRDVRCARDDP